jgi:hypothetical protein
MRRARAVRSLLAAISYAVLAVSLLSPVSPAQTEAQLARFASALRGDPAYRSENMGFWFDDSYLAFLDDLDRRLPKTPSITVAILVPRRPDLYLYQGIYRLAPRRVVEERWEEEADVVATYKTEAARGPGGEPITGGRLWTRPGSMTPTP